MVWTSLTWFVRCNGLTTFGGRIRLLMLCISTFTSFWRFHCLVGQMECQYLTSHFQLPCGYSLGSLANSLQCLRYWHWLKFYCVALLQTSDTRLNGEDLQLFGCIYSHHSLHFVTHDFSVRGATLRFSEIHVCTIVSIRYLRKNWVSCQIHFSARWVVVD